MVDLATLRRQLIASVAEAAADQLLDFIAVAETVKASALVRLKAPAPTVASTAEAPLTAAEVAARLNVPTSCVYEWARQGRVPAMRLGRYRRFDFKAVQEAIAKGLEVQESQPDDLVFPTTLGKPLHGAFLHKGLHKALDQCPKLPRVDLHGLRHTFASIAISLGKPVTEVAKILGHKDPQITLRVYAHWFAGASSASTMADVAAAMGSGGSKTVATGAAVAAASAN